MFIPSEKVSGPVTIIISLETVPKTLKIPKPVGHEMSTFLETVHQQIQNTKTQRYQRSRAIPKAIPRDSPTSLKSLRFVFLLGTVSRNMLMLWPMGFGTFGAFLLGLSRIICSCQISERSRKRWYVHCFWGCLEEHAYGLAVWPVCFGIFVCLGAVSRNMLISDFGRLRGLWYFCFLDCHKECMLFS